MEPNVPRYPLALVLVVTLLGATTIRPAQPSAEIVIRNGVIVTVEGQLAADVLIRDHEIAEIAENLTATAGAREIDASGMLVLPGGIDPHVHLGGSRADDYTSGSAAALAGGITTISNFVSPRDGEEILDALRRRAEDVRAQAIADVILHPIIVIRARFRTHSKRWPMPVTRASRSSWSGRPSTTQCLAA